MSVKRRFQESLLAICLLSTGVMPIAGQAAVIGADQYLQTIDRRATLERIDAALAREEVASRLRKLGVEPEAAMARAEALNDQELMALANGLEELPAGGSALGTIGVVFIVLLILELVGVIDIFNKI